MRPHDYLGIPWLSYSARISLIGIYALIASNLIYSRNYTTRPGDPQRLTLAIVIVAINFALPCIFHPDAEIISTAVFGLSFMWLASLKVLGWSVGRGPLMIPALSLPQFIAVAFLPITPVLHHASSSKNSRTATTKNGTNGKSNGKYVTTLQETKKGNARQDESGDGASAAALDFFFKLFCLALLLTALQKENLHRLTQEILYAFGLYLFIAIIMDCVGAVSVLLLNLNLAPHFDKPFLSSSLTDYWSRRWNLNTGYTMRFLIYDPICEGRLIKKQNQLATVSRRRRAVALCTSFLVSGIFHEFFIIYLRGRVSGYWLAFFTVQGPLLVMESLGRRWLKLRGMAVPKILSIPLTLGIMLSLGDLLFFPDVKRMGIAGQVVQNLYEMLVPAGSLDF